MSTKHRFFYGFSIVRNQEQEKIESILEDFKDEPPSEELKKKIWDLLQMEKYKGNITIPFRVVLRKDPTHLFPDQVEVILDSKV